MFLKRFLKRKADTSDPEEHGYDYLFKTLIIGDRYSGKSSLILRYVDDTYTDSPAATIDDDFKCKTIKALDGRTIKLQIRGQIPRDYLRKYVISSLCEVAHAVIICFDVTNLISIKNVKELWIGEVERYAPEDTTVIIVGTKCDLPPVVNLDAVREYTNSVNVPFMLCSAKTGEGVNEVFEKIADIVKSKVDRGLANRPEPKQREDMDV